MCGQNPSAVIDANDVEQGLRKNDHHKGARDDVKSEKNEPPVISAR